jgi:GMP synthase-like glutamine amidotransferase
MPTVSAISRWRKTRKTNVRILAFRHVPFEGIGRIQPVLENRGIEFEYADLYDAGSRIPNAADYSGLIFLGGPMSVNDPLPYLRREEQLILDAMERKQPVLGICLGAQLIAKALGASVYPNGAKEIGWFDIHFTEAARHDPLLAPFDGPETVFHWHGETFDLPQGCELLATSSACRHQAFRANNLTYGLQFHPEVTPGMIADWCTQDENCGDVRELEQPLDPERNSQRFSEFSHTLFGNWCDLILNAQRFVQSG